MALFLSERLKRSFQRRSHPSEAWNLSHLRPFTNSRAFSFMMLAEIRMLLCRTLMNHLYIALYNVS